MNTWQTLWRWLRPPPKPPTEGSPNLSYRERLRALRHLPILFKDIWRTSPGLAATSLALRTVRGAQPLAVLFVGKLIIDEVVRLMALTDTRDYGYLWQLVATELALALVAELLMRAIAVADSLLGDLYSQQSSLRLMQHAAQLDLEKFEDAAFYDKLERARQQTVGRMGLMSLALWQLQDFITLLFLAGGLVVYNPWLILLVVVALLPAFLGEAHFNAQGYSLTFARTPQRRELDYLRYSGASDETAKEIKVFGLSDYLIARYHALSSQFLKENRSLALRRAAWGTVLSALGTIGYYAAYVLIILETIAGQQSLGALTFLVGSFTRAKALLEGMLARMSSMAEQALYLRDYFEFFQLQPAIATPAQPKPVPQPIQQGFVFEDVGYCYPGSERWALRHVSFALPAGQKLALVGENGSGKTTLVKLLARLYDPTEGRILLDGTDLRDYDPAALRQHIGIIFQDFVKYQFTAGLNIATGRIEAREEGSRIVDAAEKSLASTVVAKLAQGYAQKIGKRFSGGTELSGGEWQKIALARAYMRDAELLILDEPTAALDARAEHEVFQRFVALTEGKTAVLISHRFSTVRMADTILVLQQGQVREHGSHTELLAAGGLYAELFRLQAKGYV